jgi:hypothetical protein
MNKLTGFRAGHLQAMATLGMLDIDLGEWPEHLMSSGKINEP